MKQLFIAKDVAYPTSTDMSTLADGAIALVNPADGKILTAAPTSNFSIFVGRGSGKLPRVFTEVDVKTLQVTKGTYQAGATFKAIITVPTPEKGLDYTVVIVKKGTVFNERSNWTFTTPATSTNAADVAKQLVAQINGNKYQLGVTATNSGGAIIITATEEGKDYEVLGADALTGVEPTGVTHGKKAMYDKAYIQDLASRCAAGKGFNYLGEDGKEIYPGYPEVVDADKYVLYTLRFAVPRVAAKQRDEVVYQLVHIAVPLGGTPISTLDTILGISTTTERAGGGDASKG